MIECRNLVPQYYASSPDYRVLLKLLDYVVSGYKGEIDGLSGLLLPNMCPSAYLPLLASFVGYEYDANISDEENRVYISQYTQLKHMKGSLNGVAYAIALAVKSIQKTAMSVPNLLIINKDNRMLPEKYKEYFPDSAINNEPAISVFLYSNIYSYKMWDLANAVRPAGYNIIIDSSKQLDKDTMFQQLDLKAEVVKMFRATNAGSKYSTDVDEFTEWTSGVETSVQRRYIPTNNEVTPDATTGSQIGTVGFTEISSEADD